MIIKFSFQNKHIVVTDADKFNTAVRMNRDDYINKCTIVVYHLFTV